MGKTQLKIRFFTIADFEEEETWLRAEHRKGWKLVKTLPPCFYTFEQCEPEDVIYRLSYKNCKESSDYMQLFSDYGWEYFTQCTGWLYFRKPASQIDTENESELFSENESKIQMLQEVFKTRLFPAFLFVVFQFNTLFRSKQIDGNFAFLSLISLAILSLFVYVSIKLSKLKRKYKTGA